MHDAGNEGMSGGTYSGEVFDLTLLDGPHILERYSSSTLLDCSHVGISLLFWSGILVEPFCMAQGCWHGRPLGRVIHTQNITFTKDPGQNIRGEFVDSLWLEGIMMKSFFPPVRITHNLPSGRYQVVQSYF